LWVASPAHTDQLLYTVGDRFMAGVAVAQAAWGEEGLIGTEQRESPASTPLAQHSADEEILCDVLVAGSGTAGTVAAIAAARSGGRVCAIDQAPFPGGVGTGGGIVSYYGGFSG